jgi:hypothetical protein
MKLKVKKILKKKNKNKSFTIHIFIYSEALLNTLVLLDLLAIWQILYYFVFLDAY